MSDSGGTEDKGMCTRFSFFMHSLKPQAILMKTIERASD